MGVNHVRAWMRQIEKFLQSFIGCGVSLWMKLLESQLVQDACVESYPQNAIAWLDWASNG